MQIECQLLLLIQQAGDEYHNTCVKRYEGRESQGQHMMA